ncbi:aminoglycoside phosphotransferase family protein [Micromonospora peucetia]|uniref:aminoglycoside phosphotransferase family protein n=1 Tax=Micromonospora peucetia TaxID=47871 RepID=UPI0022561B39|nr:aminoglycoside phosphotransferase family protein [Micromonospora peucetia]MCX4390816.1 aminoglycoside phosphotransferase family protein [Micromonospora peucetia]
MALDLEAIANRLEPRFGKAARRWVGTLTERLDELVAQWGLDLGDQLKSGNSSVVFRCRHPQGEAVLKLSPDSYAVREEVDMLRQFTPSGRVPAVLATARGAVLLESIHPGTLVEKMPQPPSPREYAGFLNDLHGAGDPATAPRRLEDWVDVLFNSAAQRGADLAESKRLRDDLFAEPTDTVLLHGDLHLGNVLSGGAKGLAAIDPMACAGDPCFDAVDYVLEGLDRAEMLRRRDELAEAARIDVRRLDTWCRVTAPIGATYVSNPGHSAELAAFGRGEY